MADMRSVPDAPDFTVFRGIFYYCFLIIVVPVATFFGSKFFIFDGIFRLTTIASNVYSAVISIVVLHVVLGLYIYKAYSEPSPPSGKPAKQD